MNALSVLHAIYLRCIRPYIGPESVALEIGPGSGAWTRTMLGARELWALDSQPEEELGLRQALGHPLHLRFVQSRDASQAGLPEGHFDFMFSFGCFCHLPPEGIAAYAKNLFPAMKRGSHCFWMLADYDKLNNAFERLDREKLLDLFLPRHPLAWPLRRALAMASRWAYRDKRLDKNEDRLPSPGRWYHTGTMQGCEILRAAGYRILDSDVGVSPRDPIIHFQKP
jgi:hypothetical protein